jgi:hypothetical protein
MRCSKCTYSLWGITTGRCPECDTPFRPSEFRFRTRAVSFACPHCKTAYAGTSESGHLVPAEFTCIGCNQPIAMDQMVATPAPGVPEDETLAFPNPWIDRRRLGRPRAFFRAAVEIIIEPARFMRSIVEQNPAPGSVSDAARFAGVVAIGYLSVAAAFAILAALILGFAGAGRGASVTVATVLPIVFGVGFAVALFLGPFVQAALGHGFLRLVGAGSGGFGRTFQALLYTSATSLLLAVPTAIIPMAGFVLLAWQCYAVTLMLREAHGTTNGRAFAGTFGAIFFPVFVAAACMIAFVVMAATASQAALARAQALQSQALMQAQASGATVAGAVAARSMTLLSEALAATRDATGQWPATPIELAKGDAGRGVALLAAVAGPFATNVTIGGLTGDALRAGDVAAIDAEAKRLAASRTDRLKPFAIGPVAFYYPASDGDLEDWLLVRRPTSDDPVYRIETEWSDRVIADEAEFEKALEERNAARAKRQLIPIPHPRDVSALVNVSPAPVVVPAGSPASLTPG